MKNQKAINANDLKEYAKARYEYISKMDFIKLSSELGYTEKIGLKAVIDVYNDLYN